MPDNFNKNISKIIYSPEIERALTRYKKKDKTLLDRVETQIVKICQEPNIGKPLRHSLKDRRRIHIGSFVLIYEFHNGELRFLDFDHHDKVYKKHRCET